MSVGSVSSAHIPVQSVSPAQPQASARPTDADGDHDGDTGSESAAVKATEAPASSTSNLGQKLNIVA
jgi:hypothetical protein